MTEPNDAPLAVLIALDGQEIVWALSSLPPPPEVLIPHRVPMSARVDADPTPLPEHRRFRLHPFLRSKDHRWWCVYNEGRSRTLEDGFVYLEQRAK
jgi:hypothetical protein